MDRRGLQGFQTAQDCRDYRLRKTEGRTARMTRSRQAAGATDLTGLQGRQRIYKGFSYCKGPEEFFADTFMCTGMADKLAAQTPGGVRTREKIAKVLREKMDCQEFPREYS